MTGRGFPALDLLNRRIFKLGLHDRALGSDSPILLYDQVEVGGCSSVSP